MTTPLVSVLIPTLNAERTIEMSLAAIRKQSLGPDQVEILVADGGSTDQTRAIAKSFGATVLENPRVLPEYGLSVAMAVARGRFGVFAGADEVLLNPESLATRARLLEENPLCRNVLASGLKNPPGYPLIGEYVNRFGDPFSYFMHHVDAGNLYESLGHIYPVERREPDYLVLHIADHDPLPIVDGHFFRLDYLRANADVTDHTIIPRLFVMMAKEHRRLGVTKDDYILHYSTGDYRTAARKIEWRIVGNVHHADSGSVGFASREHLQPLGWRLKKYLFIPYALTLAAPAFDALRMTARYRNPAMLYHLPLAAGAALSIVRHRALKALGIKVEHRVYGK